MADHNNSTEKLRDVEADFINPFITAMYDTMRSMGERSSRKGDAALVRTEVFNHDLLIAMRVDGTINGFVIIGMSGETARKMVSVFLFGIPIVELDEMARNAVREFSLRVAERAKKALVGREYHVNVTHGVNFGTSLEFKKKLEFIQVHYLLDYGELEVFFNIMKTQK